THSNFNSLTIILYVPDAHSKMTVYGNCINHNSYFTIRFDFKMLNAKYDKNDLVNEVVKIIHNNDLKDENCIVGIELGLENNGLISRPTLSFVDNISCKIKE
ncbi:16313_t:CDS:2, partial [Racocetra fulgida]